jgi:hypothetical protein
VRTLNQFDPHCQPQSIIYHARFADGGIRRQQCGGMRWPSCALLDRSSVLPSP